MLSTPFSTSSPQQYAHDLFMFMCRAVTHCFALILPPDGRCCFNNPTINMYKNWPKFLKTTMKCGAHLQSSGKSAARWALWSAIGHWSLSSFLHLCQTWEQIKSSLSDDGNGTYYYFNWHCPDFSGQWASLRCYWLFSLQLHIPLPFPMEETVSFLLSCQRFFVF